MFTLAFLSRALFIASALWLCLELPVAGRQKKNSFS